MNNVILHGRLTRDVELKNANNGTELCKFSVAIDRPTKDRENKVTDFIPCVAFKERAAFISKYFHQGDGILIEGSIQSHKYTDRDGNARTAYEVAVNRAEFAEKKLQTGGDIAPTPSGADDEELPF